MKRALTLDQVTDVTCTLTHAALSHDTRPRQVQTPNTQCRAGQPMAEDRKHCTLCSPAQVNRFPDLFIALYLKLHVTGEQLSCGIISMIGVKSPDMLTRDLQTIPISAKNNWCFLIAVKWEMILQSPNPL